MVDDPGPALTAYYDQEAAARAERRIDPERVTRRSAFVERVGAERLSIVLEVGTGPGRDAEAFVAVGRHVVGIDLSTAHARLARACGVGAAVASAYALPFADDSCDAGWSMSTLLHIPNTRIDEALTEVCRVLRPDAPLAIGVWGALVDTEGVNDGDEIEPKRFFSRRSSARLRAILERYGRIETFDTWAHGSDPDWIYQYVVLRTFPVVR